MSELISGKEALIALGEGKEVEFKDSIEKWENIKHHMNLDLSMFLASPEWMVFRLKPRNITINGIEVPAPFEPKKGERFYYFSDEYTTGYASAERTGFYGDMRLGVWRTEDEIKQVVEALRSIFEC